MKVLLYRADHWRKGQPALSVHETQTDAKRQAMRLAVILFGNNPPISLACLAASSFVIAYSMIDLDANGREKRLTP